MKKKDFELIDMKKVFYVQNIRNRLFGKKAKYVHIQVALFQNDSVFHQLGQNMTTDCSSDLHKISVRVDQIYIAIFKLSIKNLNIQML